MQEAILELELTAVQIAMTRKPVAAIIIAAPLPQTMAFLSLNFRNNLADSAL